jgi:hypothetical protein
VKAWLEAPDLAVHKKIGVEIQLPAFQSVPYWRLGLSQQLTAYRHDITGVTEGFPKFWNVRRTWRRMMDKTNTSPHHCPESGKNHNDLGD